MKKQLKFQLKFELVWPVLKPKQSALLLEYFVLVKFLFNAKVEKSNIGHLGARDCDNDNALDSAHNPNLGPEKKLSFFLFHSKKKLE